MTKHGKQKNNNKKKRKKHQGKRGSTSETRALEMNSIAKSSKAERCVPIAARSSGVQMLKS